MVTHYLCYCRTNADDVTHRGPDANDVSVCGAITNHVAHSRAIAVHNLNHVTVTDRVRHDLQFPFTDDDRVADSDSRIQRVQHVHADGNGIGNAVALQFPDRNAVHQLVRDRDAVVVHDTVGVQVEQLHKLGVVDRECVTVEVHHCIVLAVGVSDGVDDAVPVRYTDVHSDNDCDAVVHAYD